MIALTGGTGFLGSHIADALLAAGHQVRVAVRATSDLRWLADKPLETCLVDLADPAACRDFLAGTVGLIHCAGLVSADNEAAYQAANVQTTRNLAAASAWDGSDTAVFLLVSSLAAHGPAPLRAPATEDSPCRPLTAYGRSKLAAEQALLATPGGFRKVILRPPSLYGPRDREFLPLLKAATRGWTFRLGKSLTGLSLVDGRDAADAALALLTTETASGAFFVSDRATGYDWDQLRDILTRVVDRPVRRVTVPLGLLRALAPLAGALGDDASLLLNRDRVRDLASEGWVCDGSRLFATTGFAPRYDALTGLTETLAFYREQSWL